MIVQVPILRMEDVKRKKTEKRENEKKDIGKYGRSTEDVLDVIFVINTVFCDMLMSILDPDLEVEIENETEDDLVVGIVEVLEVDQEA